MTLFKLLLRRPRLLKNCIFCIGSTRSYESLAINPRISLFDVPITITLKGLTPLHPYTLSAYTVDDANKEFSSFAWYFADADGVINPSRNTSVGGSYKGIFPSGLLTTLGPHKATPKYSVLYKKDMLTPLKIKINIHKGHLSNSIEAERALLSTDIERYYTSPDVKRISVKGKRIRGALYLPSGSNLKPGVINLNGLQNGLKEYRSALLASRGIASLTLSYAGYDDLPFNHSSFDIETIEEAVEFLLSQDSVIPDRCGMISFCVGGAVGILSGILFDKVKAVVALNPQNYLMGLNIFKDSKLFIKAKPYEEYFRKVNNIYWPHPENRTIDESAENLLPFKNIQEDTSFLFIRGKEDLEFNVQRSSSYFFQKYKKYNYEEIICEGAGHEIDPPYTPLIEIALYNYWPKRSKPKAYPFSFRGNARDTVRAQEAVWPKVRSFIQHNIRDKSEWYQKSLQNNF